MITFFLIFLLTISVVIIVLLSIIIKNILRKNSIYEQYIINVKNNVESALIEMREIDKQGVFSTGINSETGLFESNDPTSQIFKQLLYALEDLSAIIE